MRGGQVSIIKLGLEIVGGVVILACTHAFFETIFYVIDLEKEHAKRLDGFSGSAKLDNNEAE